MGLKEKVAEALQRLQPDHIQLEDDDGISGFVVSRQFRKLSGLDRQALIDKALRASSKRLSKAELSHVLAIAGLTPAEYAALGDAEDGGHQMSNAKRG